MVDVFGARGESGSWFCKQISHICGGGFSNLSQKHLIPVSRTRLVPMRMTCRTFHGVGSGPPMILLISPPEKKA